MGEVVIVCGGRYFKDRKVVFDALDSMSRQIDIVVTGGARGADTLADEWAQARGKARIIFPANWDGEGRAAGHIRNRRMLDIAKPKRVIAFPGGAGTEGMKDIARTGGVIVTVIDPETWSLLS